MIRATPKERKSQSDAIERARQVGALTLALWVVSVSIGALGFAIPYSRPRLAPPPLDPAVDLQHLQVELQMETEIPTVEPRPIDPTAPPPPPDLLPMPAVVQPIAVARPEPSVEFALPVAGPVRIVDVAAAAYSRPATNNNMPARMAAPPKAQQLIFGQGEGKQPAPEYPRQAIRQGQEGTVMVRLTVDESGSVTSANLEIPSPWPLLNEAALRVVREKWHFSRAPSRIYDVAIRFEIVK